MRPRPSELRIDPDDFDRKPVFVDKRGSEYMKMPGQPRVLTPMQEVDLAAWMKARRSLGTTKTKAAELGIPEPTLRGYLRRIRLGS